MSMLVRWEATGAFRLREHEFFPDDDTRELYFVMEQAWISTDGEVKYEPVTAVDEHGKEIEVMLRGLRR